VPVDLATGVGKPLKQFPLLGWIAILPARHSHLRIGVSTALVSRPYCDGMAIAELNLDLWPCGARRCHEKHCAARIRLRHLADKGREYLRSVPTGQESWSITQVQIFVQRNEKAVVLR